MNERTNERTNEWMNKQQANTKDQNNKIMVEWHSEQAQVNKEQIVF